MYFTVSLLSHLSKGHCPSTSPSPKIALCQFWFKVTQQIWRRNKIAKILQRQRQTKDIFRPEKNLT